MGTVWMCPKLLDLVTRGAGDPDDMNLPLNKRNMFHFATRLVAHEIAHILGM